MRKTTVTIVENTIRVNAPPHVSIRLRRNFGGAQRYKAGVFDLTATPEHAYDLEWFGERYPFEIDPASAERFRDLVSEHRRKLEVIAAMDSADYVPRKFDLALPPRDYQRLAADLALQSGSLLVADQLGLGKTVTAICALSAPGVLPALVVTMTHLTRQWELEIARFAPSLRVHRIRRGQPYKFSDMRVEKDPITGRRKVVRYEGVPDVILINYHKLHGWVETLSGVVRTLVVDEAQEFRRASNGTRRSLKYEAGRALADVVDMRIGLSATPVYNYGNEIYNVMEVIAPGSLGTSKEFYDEWCGGPPGPDGRARVNDPAALGSYLRESGLMIRRTRKEVGREIPQLTVVRHAVECDPDSIHRAAGDVAELAQRVLDRIGSPAERMQRAGELDWRLRQATGIAKAGAVADLVRMLVDGGEKVVLFGWHHEVYSLWQSHLDRQPAIKSVLYTGKQSDSQKAAAAKEFIHGDAQVLSISLRAGAGLDGLQFASCTGVIGELDWSPRVIEQDIGRLHRDGQTDPVIVYVPVADEGSDPVISDVLGIKDAQSHYLLNPDAPGGPELTGASEDHIRKLAEDVLRRRGRAA